MFRNKKLIRLKGSIYKINLKIIEEEDLYNKEIEMNSNLFYQNEFILLENLNFIEENEEIKIKNKFSGINSFKNKIEMLKDQNIKKVDSILAEEIIEKLEENNFCLKVEKYEFISPEIKISDEKLELSKIKFEMVDLAILSDELLESELISDIYYNNKKINIQKQGFIFKSEIKKELKEIFTATFNLESDLPCLENKF